MLAESVANYDKDASVLCPTPVSDLFDAVLEINSVRLREETLKSVRDKASKSNTLLLCSSNLYGSLKQNSNTHERSNTNVVVCLLHSLVGASCLVYHGLDKLPRVGSIPSQRRRRDSKT